VGGNDVPSWSKPEVAEVYGFLRRHAALIVHFSGTPKGAGSDFEHMYPADLENVIALGALGGVSCSVVRPGDEFAGQDANATGCIGVVLGLRDKNSLVAADPHDCGSYVENGVRKAPERNLTADDLEVSLTKRPSGSYNEWVMRDYIILGIFAAPPFRVSKLEVPKYPADMPDYLKDQTPVPSFTSVCPAELVATFPRHSLFSAYMGELVRLSGEGIVPCDHATIYTIP